MNKLTKVHRQLLYWTFGMLLLTGAVWAVLHYMSRTLGIGEDASRAAAAWLMKLHGAAAMAGLLLLGSLLPLHVRTGLQVGLNAKSGVGMLFGVFALSATGWLLYYAGSDSVRETSSLVHLFLGLLLCVLLPVHLTRLADRQQVQPLTGGLP